MRIENRRFWMIVYTGTNAAMTLRRSDLGNTWNNWIGRPALSVDPHVSSFVDDFRAYGRALSASEVTSL